MSPQIDSVLQPIKVSDMVAGKLVWLGRVDPETGKQGLATMLVVDVGYAQAQFLCTVTGARFYAYRGGFKREELYDHSRTWLTIYEYREWE